MMALEQRRIVTYADYAAMPDDGKQYELIDGQLFLTPSPSYRHQKLADRILQALGNYLDKHPIGDAISAPFDVVLNPEETAVLQPDVLYVSNACRNIIEENRVLFAARLLIGTITFVRWTLKETVLLRR